MAFDFARSTSQRRTFRTCGVLYSLKYGQGWAPKRHNAAMDMGIIMEAVAGDILRGAAPTEDLAAKDFTDRWAGVKARTDLRWPKTKGWDFYAARGAALARVMAVELPKRIRIDEDAVFGRDLVYEVAPGVRERAILDFRGRVQRGRLFHPENGEGETRIEWGGDYPLTVLDFKTADRARDPLAAEIDEQLTSYQVGTLQRDGVAVDQVGLCVLIYGTQPRVQWLLEPARPDDQVAAFLHSAVEIDKLIRAETFVRNDQACFNYGACDMLGLCYGSQRARIARDLVRDQRKGPEAIDLLEEG